MHAVIENLNGLLVLLDMKWAVGERPAFSRCGVSGIVRARPRRLENEESGHENLQQTHVYARIESSNGSVLRSW
jgi:hypothetical protein